MEHNMIIIEGLHYSTLNFWEELFETDYGWYWQMMDFQDEVMMKVIEWAMI